MLHFCKLQYFVVFGLVKPFLLSISLFPHYSAFCRYCQLPMFPFISVHLPH